MSFRCGSPAATTRLHRVVGNWDDPGNVCMVWPLVMVLSSRETALNGIRNPDEKVTLIPSVWRIPRWPPGPAEYRYPHPSRGRAGPCKQRPISRDLQKRTTLWPVGDAPSVRPDRSARYLDDQE